MSGGPYQLQQSFFDRMPDSQAHLTRGSRWPTELEEEVITFEAALQTHVANTTSNCALMLSFKCGVPGVTTINLTGNEAITEGSLLRGSIAQDFNDDMETSTAPFSHLNHSRDGLISSTAPSHTGSVLASAPPSTSNLQTFWQPQWSSRKGLLLPSVSAK